MGVELTNCVEIMIPIERIRLQFVISNPTVNINQLKEWSVTTTQLEISDPGSRLGALSEHLDTPVESISSEPGLKILQQI